MLFFIFLLLYFSLTGCLFDTNTSYTESVNSFQSISRTIVNNSLCYQIPGSPLVCLTAPSDINLSSINPFVWNSKSLNASPFIVFKDPDTNALCYKTTSGSLSCSL